MIWCFGDSWGKGEELDFRCGKNHEHNSRCVGEKPFVHWVAKELGQEYTNVSKEGGAFGIICIRFFGQSHNIKNGDLVLVVLPPDVRWYDEQHGEFATISMGKNEVETAKRYWELLGNRTEAWFIYHHSLFIFSIQQACKERGAKLVMMHNYGNLEIAESFIELIDMNNFMTSKKQSLTFLLQDWDYYGVDQFNLKEARKMKREIDGPHTDNFTGKYFEGKSEHPNELGHKKIADLIIKKLGDKG